MNKIGQHTLLIFLVLCLIGFLSRLGPWGSTLFNLEFDYTTLFSPFNPDDSTSFQENIVVIYLDEESHQVLHQPYDSTWNRSLHAEVIDKLTQAETKLVYIDILFDSPSSYPESDQQLAKSIRDNGKVILIAQISQSVSGAGTRRSITPPNDIFRDAAAGWGLAAFAQDQDGAIRTLPLFQDNIPSGPWVAALFLKNESTGSPAQSTTSDYMRFSHKTPALAENTWSYHQVLNEHFPIHKLKNKWIFIGAKQSSGFSGSGKDTFLSPYTRLTGHRWNGVDFHVVALENYLTGTSINSSPIGRETIYLIISATLLCLVLLIPSYRPRILYVVCFAILLPVSGIYWASTQSITYPFLSVLFQIIFILIIVSLDRPYVYDLFISYSHFDLKRLGFLNQFLDALQHEGIKTWIDKNDINLGKKWRNSILDGIEKSRGFSVLLSKNTPRSLEILTEIRLASHKNLVIIPVFIEKADGLILKKEIEGLHSIKFNTANPTKKELQEKAKLIRKELKISIVRRTVTKLFNKNDFPKTEEDQKSNIAE